MPFTVFAGSAANNDIELFGTDGTTGRTFLIKNINPSGNAFVGNTRAQTGGSLAFAVIGNFAYFSADDGTNGPELWRTDGTNAGTTKVTEFFTTSGTADPSDDVKGFAPTNIVAANGFIFFVGSGPAATNPGTSPARTGIWKYDPVGNTTTFVSGDNVLQMFASGNRIYWSFDAQTSFGLSTTDGNSAAQNIITGGINSPPAAIYDAAGTIYYGFNGGVKKVVGTTATDLTGDPFQPSGFISTGSDVYIIAQNTNQLFVTNPLSTVATEITAAGLSFDFQNGGPGAHTPGFAALGNLLIFSNNKTNAGVGGNTGSELWVSDGTAAGTQLLKDIVPGTGSSNPHNFIAYAGAVFFQATNGNGSVELWKTDGTAAGTVLVETIFAGGANPTGFSFLNNLNFDNMTVSNGILYFSFDDQAHGSELWRTDGTAAGTLQVKDLNTSTIDSSFQINNPNTGANFGATSVFVGWTQQAGYELFTTNGTQAGTGLLVDIAPGGGSSVPQQMVQAGARAFFTAYSPLAGVELWLTDGTAAGTVLVKDIGPNGNNNPPTGLTAIGNNIYFSASNGVNGSELWFSDGTAAGTFMVKDIDATTSGGFPRDSNPGGFVESGGLVYFTATTFADGRELWVTDGTPGGTHITRNIGAGAIDANIFSSLVAFNGKIYFSAQDSGATSKGIELYVSDGTGAGTVILKDINTTPEGSGTSGSNPTDIQVVNGQLFFRAQSTGSGSEVYVSNGTVGNATAISPTFSTIGSLVGAGNQLFFTAVGANGQELYVTSGGNATLLDIVAGVNGSNASNLFAFGTKVLFTAQNTATNGNELWISDGGAVGAGPTGTFQLKNINPTSGASSDPSNFVLVGSKVYFVANDGTNGRELWVTDGTSVGTKLVANIGPGAADGSVSPLRATDSTHLLFLANDGVHGQELWITDGTTTFRATDVVQPGTGILPGPGFFGINGGGTPSGTFATVPLTLPAGATGETFSGTADPDYFDGLGGNDYIDGGPGADFMRGGPGNDTIIVDNAGDVVSEAVGQGFDNIATSISFTLPAGAEFEVFSTTNVSGTGAFTMVGNEFGQSIIGNAGNNYIDGGGGADNLQGQGGNDTYIVDANDVVSEAVGAGIDTVAAKETYVLPAGAEIEILSTTNDAGTSPITLVGNGFNQTLIGNAGNNYLDGGGGADTMRGLGGNDTYITDGNDIVVEAVGGGIDTVAASATYTLAAGAEIEVLSTTNDAGSSNITLVGNSFNQTLVGNAGANYLDGGGGADTLRGNGGNDTYIVSGDDFVIEAVGGGTDTVAAVASYTLSINAEIEVLSTTNNAGTAAIDLTGNDFAQSIFGNAGANVLNGGGGNDLMQGFGGADSFVFTSPLGPNNIDTIADMVTGVDKIVLENAVFTGLAAGILPANAFAIGAAAADADDRIIYNPNTGALFFDADGNGPGAQVQFATLGAGTPLASADFVVI